MMIWSLALAMALGVFQDTTPVEHWRGQRVVLTRPIYSFVVEGMYGPERRFVTCISAEFGVFYQHGRDKDTDINRLAQAVAPYFTTKPSFAYRRNPTPATPLQVQTFEAGTTLLVKNVNWNEKDVTLEFALPLDPKKVVTTLRVMWPTPPSGGPAYIEGLIRNVLKEAGQ
jgi:hypothetical protein